MLNFLKKNKKEKQYPPYQRGGWWRIHEPFTGAWQKNIELKRETILCFPAIFSCVSLISSDIAKLPINYVMEDSNGIWVKTKNPHKVVERPNSYQNRIQFFENWMNSKLIRGNTYILKERDGRGDVVGLHVLHPDLVLALVSDDGQVFYQLGQDNLAGLNPAGVTVPASEIIHDRFNCFFHPLIGLGPIFAAGLPAYMGIKMMENSAKHFQNGARPSGILTVPEAISKEDAEALSQQWEAKYGGENYGKVAILGGDLKYQGLSMTAEESQMVEQLKLTSDLVCATFRVPAYKVLGTQPNMGNVEALEQTYYSQCLQILIEAVELLLDEGFDVKEGSGFEFDLDVLLRMDTKTQVETLAAAVKGGIDTPNEARKRRNQKPLEGGDTVWLQQQEWPIEVLANRREGPDDSTLQVELDETRAFASGAMRFSKIVKDMKFDAQ